ncbi:MAG: exodeoxyribonuclease III [Actinobacteria bacterium]|nr:exodeoxyribonuclease III [Actinomycetota bacterium]
MAGVLTICTVNVNGVRAAHRRGGIDWLKQHRHDAVLLQEVRASDEQLRQSVAELEPTAVAHAQSDTPGRSGVAIVSGSELADVTIGVGAAEFESSGRWVEATLNHSDIGAIRLVSVYIHSGEAGTEKQDEKYRFLDAMTTRLAELAADPTPTLVCGDFNIARTERDIKNAKGNRNKAGFLAAEREYLSGWLDSGWVDLGRAHAGEVDGPYTWWSWRGQAFDRDTGWRIDCAYATETLAQRLADVTVGRAASYAERWSDHAPVTVAFH